MDANAPWMIEAKQCLGIKEIPGPKHESKIVSWWKKIRRGGIKDDETPWCAAFVGSMLESVGITSSRFEGASSYRQWGQPCMRPIYGAIVVLSRPGGAHVGFCVGRDNSGNIAVLGGNQNNMVSVALFQMSRIDSWRWPMGVPFPQHRPLPLYNKAEFSKSEA